MEMKNNWYKKLSKSTAILMAIAGVSTTAVITNIAVSKNTISKAYAIGTSNITKTNDFNNTTFSVPAGTDTASFSWNSSDTKVQIINGSQTGTAKTAFPTYFITNDGTHWGKNNEPHFDSPLYSAAPNSSYRITNLAKTSSGESVDAIITMTGNQEIAKYRNAGYKQGVAFYGTQDLGNTGDGGLHSLAVLVAGYKSLSMHVDYVKAGTNTKMTLATGNFWSDIDIGQGVYENQSNQQAIFLDKTDRYSLSINGNDVYSTSDGDQAGDDMNGYADANKGGTYLGIGIGSGFDMTYYTPYVQAKNYWLAGQEDAWHGVFRFDLFGTFNNIVLPPTHPTEKVVDDYQNDINGKDISIDQHRHYQTTQQVQHLLSSTKYNGVSIKGTVSDDLDIMKYKLLDKNNNDISDHATFTKTGNTVVATIKSNYLTDDQKYTLDIDTLPNITKNPTKNDGQKNVNYSGSGSSSIDYQVGSSNKNYTQDAGSVSSATDFNTPTINTKVYSGTNEAAASNSLMLSDYDDLHTYKISTELSNHDDFKNIGININLPDVETVGSYTVKDENGTDITNQFNFKANNIASATNNIKETSSYTVSAKTPSDFVRQGKKLSIYLNSTTMKGAGYSDIKQYVDSNDASKINLTATSNIYDDYNNYAPEPDVVSQSTFDVGQVVSIASNATNESNGYSLVNHQNWQGTIVSKTRIPHTSNSDFEYYVLYSDGSHNDHVLEQDLRALPNEQSKYYVGQVVAISSNASAESNGYSLVNHRGWWGTVVSKTRIPHTSNSDFEYYVRYSDGSHNDHVLEQDLEAAPVSSKRYVNSNNVNVLNQMHGMTVQNYDYQTNNNINTYDGTPKYYLSGESYSVKPLADFLDPNDTRYKYTSYDNKTKTGTAPSSPTTDFVVRMPYILPKMSSSLSSMVIDTDKQANGLPFKLLINTDEYTGNSDSNTASLFKNVSFNLVIKDPTTGSILYTKTLGVSDRLDPTNVANYNKYSNGGTGFYVSGVLNTNIDPTKYDKGAQIPVQVDINVANNTDMRVATTANPTYRTYGFAASEKVLSSDDANFKDSTANGITTYIYRAPQRTIKSTVDPTASTSQSNVTVKNESYTVKYSPDFGIKAGYGFKENLSLNYSGLNIWNISSGKDLTNSEFTVNSTTDAGLLTDVSNLSDYTKSGDSYKNTGKDYLSSTKNVNNIGTAQKTDGLAQADKIDSTYSPVFARASLSSSSDTTKYSTNSANNLASGAIDGGNKFYVPEFAKLGIYNQSLNYGTNGQNRYGQNYVSMNLNRKINIYAPMYLEANSNTDKNAELSIQPVFKDTVVPGFTTEQQNWLKNTK